jgi:hypothetical protein
MIWPNEHTIASRRREERRGLERTSRYRIEISAANLERIAGSSHGELLVWVIARDSGWISRDEWCVSLILIGGSRRRGGGLDIDFLGISIFA